MESADEISRQNSTNSPERAAELHFYTNFWKLQKFLNNHLLLFKPNVTLDIECVLVESSSAEETPAKEKASNLERFLNVVKSFLDFFTKN
jgi:hypothetical protein